MKQADAEVVPSSSPVKVAGLNRVVFFSWIPVNRGLDVNISCEVLRINGLFYP